MLLGGFPGSSVGKEFTCNAGEQERRFDPWVGKLSWRRAWQPPPPPLFLPRESRGKRSLAGYSPQGRREWDTTEETEDVPTLVLYHTEL